MSLQVPAAPLAGGTAASHALSLRTHRWTIGWFCRARVRRELAAGGVGAVVVAAVCVPRLPGGGAREHDSHARDLRGVPGADGLIERGGKLEHPPHVRDLRGVPRADGSIERGGDIDVSKMQAPL